MTAEEKKIFDKNCSSIILAPFCFIDSDMAKTVGFLNSYLDDIKRDFKPHNPLFCLFKPSDFARFEEFLQKEREGNLQFVDEYDYAGGYTVMVYSIDKSFDKDYQLFLEGKYSKMSKAFIDSLPTVYKRKDNLGRYKDELVLARLVINKSPLVKNHWETAYGLEFGEDDEIWSAPNLEKEVLDIENLKVDENG